jgi:hypothetical protein
LPEPSATKRRTRPRARHNGPLSTEAGQRTTARADGKALPKAAASASFDLEAWVRQSRGRQGLPAKVEDPDLLAEVTAFLLGSA